MHVHKKQLLLTLILMVAAGRQSAQASGITGEQIIATFGGVVVAGSIANDPSAGVNTYLNNATTAVYNINNNVVNNNVASSNMNWGTYSEPYWLSAGQCPGVCGRHHSLQPNQL